MTFVEIKPGAFLMGSPPTERMRNDDETRHRVVFTKPYFIATREVMRGQFAEFVASTGYVTDAESDGFGFYFTGKEIDRLPDASWRKTGFDQTDEHPVVNVSWNDAAAFALWLGSRDGKRYRLPTEAEWEFACRAGTQTVYPWGDDFDEGRPYGNVADRALKKEFPQQEMFSFDDTFAFTSPVGRFQSIAGLFDMSGNVAEWCADWYAPFAAAEVKDPTGPVEVPPAQEYRVFRGGAWYYGPFECRVAHRRCDAPSYRSLSVGFRLCRDP